MIIGVVLSSFKLFAGEYQAVETSLVCDHPLSISELLYTALKNHPSTKYAWWQRSVAQAQVAVAQSPYFPTLDAKIQGIRQQDFQFIDGPNTTSTIAMADLYLSFMVYDFGARSASVDSAKQMLLAAGWNGDRKIQEIMIEVLENTYGLLHAQENLAATTLSCEEAQKLFLAAREMNVAGLTPITDLYLAQASLAQFQMQVASMRGIRDFKAGKLATSLGLPPDTMLVLAPVDPMPMEMQEATQELLSKASYLRSDLLARQAMVESSLAKVRESWLQHAPKISFEASGGISHTFDDPAKSGQYRVGLSFDIPIYNGFRTTYLVKMAEANAQVSQAELALLKQQIALEILEHSVNLQACRQMLPQAKDVLDCSKLVYEGVLEKYRAGKENMRTLASSLHALAEARVNYSDVKTKWLVTAANLAYSSGSLQPPEERTR